MWSLGVTITMSSSRAPDSRSDPQPSRMAGAVLRIVGSVTMRSSNGPATSRA